MSVEPPIPAPPQNDASPTIAQLCPGCGYDLRATTSERCTECGLPIDRAAIQTSAMPWAHRRQIGRVRAFVRTVWYVTIDTRRIRHELARPLEPRDAANFRAVNAACVAVALIGAAAATLRFFGLESIAIQPISPFSFPARSWPPGYQQDAAVPWCAGATLWQLIPVYLIALATYLTGMGQTLMRLAAYPCEHRERARTMSLYAAGPLAWLLPAAVFYAGSLGLRHWNAASDEPIPFFRPSLLMMQGMAVVFTAIALFSAFHRSGEWFARAHHAGAGRFAGGIAELLVRSIVGILLFLGVVPWCAGLAWIVIDSFR